LVFDHSDWTPYTDAITAAIIKAAVVAVVFIIV
jgi:hypothetical protein